MDSAPAELAWDSTLLSPPPPGVLATDECRALTARPLLLSAIKAALAAVELLLFFAPPGSSCCWSRSEPMMMLGECKEPRSRDGERS